MDGMESHHCPERTPQQGLIRRAFGRGRSKRAAGQETEKDKVDGLWHGRYRDRRLACWCSGDHWARWSWSWLASEELERIISPSPCDW